MSNTESAAWLIGWVAWAVTWALALRLGVAWALRRRFSVAPFPAAMAAYVVILATFFASAKLHEAILGPMQIYGATPREAFSVQAYIAAPFGLPLIVGGWLVLVGDVVWDVVRFTISRCNKMART